MTNTLAPVPSQRGQAMKYGYLAIQSPIHCAPRAQEDGSLLIGETYLYSGMIGALILSNIAREIQQIDLV
jgi:hypothetical protein